MSTNTKRVFYIYEIYDSLNEMYYIGQRLTKCAPEDDNYAGSSQLMHFGGWYRGHYFAPIFKNPKWKNYLTKRILHVKLTQLQANELEKLEIKTYREKYGVLKVYNISDGGQSGNLGPEVCKRISDKRKKLYQDKLFKERMRKATTAGLQNEKTRQKMSESAKRRGYNGGLDYDKNGEGNPMFGKQHTQSSINKMKQKKKELNESNKVYGAKGRKWYKNPKTKECSYFTETEVPKGWVLGRYMKNSLN